MTEVGDFMYASEQICIPPTYPYILRQFAKAAIRTQPTDLLRWSTAYFRCLALSLPPPVKPRLEYPIPRDHFGVTPGWLRALLHQRQDDLTVKYRALWERWMGACLNRDTLIEILLLGGFQDADAIPWFRFIAMCAAHLTDNLTQTMILVCELLTEEPDGGSAMIPLELFVDIYQFLANIDASKAIILPNIYFSDSALGLIEKKEAAAKVDIVEKVASTETVLSLTSEEIIEEVKEEKKESRSTVSCPDIVSDQFRASQESEEPEVASQATLLPYTPRALDMTNIHEQADVKSLDSQDAIDFPGSGMLPFGIDEMRGEGSDKTEGSTIYKAPSEDDDGALSVLMYSAFDKISIAPTEVSSITTGIMPQRVMADPELGKELAAQFESGTMLLGEDVDVDVEKYKLELLMQGMPHLRDDEQPSTAQYKDIKTPPSSSQEEERRLEEEEEAAAAAAAAVETEEKKYEEVYIEAVPGIGGIVPARLVKAVVVYMKEVSITQHGMVMPRNIRHYTCPPLEVTD